MTTNPLDWIQNEAARLEANDDGQSPVNFVEVAARNAAKAGLIQVANIGLAIRVVEARETAAKPTPAPAKPQAVLDAEMVSVKARMAAAQAQAEFIRATGVLETSTRYVDNGRLDAWGGPDYSAVVDREAKAAYDAAEVVVRTAEQAVRNAEAALELAIVGPEEIARREAEHAKKLADEEAFRSLPKAQRRAILAARAGGLR